MINEKCGSYRTTVISKFLNFSRKLALIKHPWISWFHTHSIEFEQSIVGIIKKQGTGNEIGNAQFSSFLFLIFFSVNLEKEWNTLLYWSGVLTVKVKWKQLLYSTLSKLTKANSKCIKFKLPIFFQEIKELIFVSGKYVWISILIWSLHLWVWNLYVLLIFYEFLCSRQWSVSELNMAFTMRNHSTMSLRDITLTWYQNEEPRGY